MTGDGETPADRAGDAAPDGGTGSGTDDGTGTESDGDADAESDRSLWERTWRALLAAGGWVADTFRGHSGARELKNRER